MNMCPECSKSLSVKAKCCSCGWVKIEEKKSVIADHRCQYVIGNQRCSLHGTICSYPYSNGPWYCTQHWQSAIFEGVTK